MLNRLYLWCRSTFMRRRLEREMREEMLLHLERSTARLIERGMTPGKAAVAARREFGHIDLIQEQARDARGQRWIETTFADARYALRQFRRAPLSATAMVIVLALGIGANAALFTVLHSMRNAAPPGVAADDALVRIRGSLLDPGGRTFARDVSYPEVQAIAARQDLFSTVAASGHADGVLEIAHADGTHNVSGRITYVTDNWFSALGVQPVIGAGLPATPLNAEPALALAALISHELWRTYFGGTRDVLGRTMKVSGATVVIAGVAPAGFRGTSSRPSDIWLPLAARPHIAGAGMAVFSSPDSAFLGVVARLQPGMFIDRATREAELTAPRFASAVALRRGWTPSADVAPLRASNEYAYSDDTFAPYAAAGGALTLLILLVTCTNVSGLMVGIGIGRRREIAVRLSLGAARARVVRQLLTESTLLAMAAGALALFTLWSLMQTFGARASALGMPLLFDWTTLLFTAGLALATGILFGLSPALHATRLAVADVLKDSAAAVAGTRSWLQHGMIVAQIALTQPLLVGIAATAVIIAGDARGMADGSVSEHIAEVRLNPFSGVASTVEERRMEMELIRARLAGMPGVTNAVLDDYGQMSQTVTVHPADRSDRSPLPDSILTHFDLAAPGYFELMAIPILRGRAFEDADVGEDFGTVVIGDDVARDAFGAVDPIGRRFVRSDGRELVVVGVVDAAAAGASASRTRDRMRIFVPHSGLAGTVLVRTTGPAAPLLSSIRSVVAAEAPRTAVAELRTLAQVEAEQRRMMLQASAAAAGGGLLALLLSAIGLYALISLAVTRNLREIGIRSALGARPRQVVGVFFASGLRMTLLGLTLGLPLSLILLRVLGSMVGLPMASTPVVATLVAVLVLTVACLAVWLPARRAAGVDPLIALRAE